MRGIENVKEEVTLINVGIIENDPIVVTDPRGIPVDKYILKCIKISIPIETKV